MRITSKGQVTIPADLRQKAGFLPETEVEFRFEEGVLTLVKAKTSKKATRGAKLIAHLKGKGDVTMSTDQIMSLTRGD